MIITIPGAGVLAFSLIVSVLYYTAVVQASESMLDST